jgi:uncharacterized protein YndB with AHSA1/START domain
MSRSASASSIVESLLVEAPIESAFTTFTNDIGSWWPPDRHVLKAELAAMVFEPRVGGHVYDVGTDGSECHWARVLVYEPPNRVVFSWDVNPYWQIEQDPAKTSEVEVRFISEAPNRTRVELEHRNLERHGARWEEMRAAVGSPEGWAYNLRSFADRVSTLRRQP